MKKDNLFSEAEKILKQRNLVLIFAFFLLLSNISLSILLISKDSEVVLVPNFLNKNSVISKEKASKEYMEAITRDVINLMLNITPDNTSYIEKNILSLTHPRFYGDLKSALTARSKDVIDRHISTYFAPRSMAIEKNGVYVVGNLSTFIGKKEVSREEKTYFVEYSFSSFKPLIVGFKEITEKKKS